MEKIRYIDTSKVLTIDIETVRLVKNYSDLSEGYQEAWEYKNKQEGVIPTQEELSEKWDKSASLYPEFSKVCSISLVYLGKNNELKCKQYTSFTEKLILEEFAKDLDMFGDKFPPYYIMGHSSNFFDIPFLCKRYIINYMPIPRMLDFSECKPWEGNRLDTNDMWKSFGGSGSSLVALCNVLGLETSKTDLAGDEIGYAYFKGELVRIANYCSLDTIATFNVLRRLKNESTFLFENVIYVNKGHILSLPDQEPLIKDIYLNKKISASNEKKILELVESLSAEERNNFILILKAAISKEEKNYTKKEVELFEKLTL